MPFAKVKLTGTRRNQCPVCGAPFASDAAFTMHRIGRYTQNERRCLSPSGMAAKGMFKGDDGFWRSEKMPEGAFFSKKG